MHEKIRCSISSFIIHTGENYPCNWAGYVIVVSMWIGKTDWIGWHGCKIAWNHFDVLCRVIALAGRHARDVQINRLELGTSLGTFASPVSTLVAFWRGNTINQNPSMACRFARFFCLDHLNHRPVVIAGLPFFLRLIGAKIGGSCESSFDKIRRERKNWWAHLEYRNIRKIINII